MRPRTTFIFTLGSTHSWFSKPSKRIDLNINFYQLLDTSETKTPCLVFNVFSDILMSMLKKIAFTLT